MEDGVGIVELIQLVTSGGGAAVLAWIVFQYSRGEIISRKTHTDVMEPLKETVAHLRGELRSTTAEARQAILDITANQKAAMEEQAKTIAILRELLERQERKAGER